MLHPFFAAGNNIHNPQINAPRIAKPIRSAPEWRETVMKKRLIPSSSTPGDDMFHSHVVEHKTENQSAPFSSAWYKVPEGNTRAYKPRNFDFARNGFTATMSIPKTGIETFSHPRRVRRRQDIEYRFTCPPRSQPRSGSTPSYFLVKCVPPPLPLPCPFCPSRYPFTEEVALVFYALTVNRVASLSHSSLPVTLYLASRATSPVVPIIRRY